MGYCEQLCYYTEKKMLLLSYTNVKKQISLSALFGNELKPDISKVQITVKLSEKPFLRPEGENKMHYIPVVLLFNRGLATRQILSVLVMSKNIQ